MIIDSESLGEINKFLYVVIYRNFINESVKEVNVFKNPMPLGVGVSGLYQKKFIAYGKMHM